MGGKCKRERVVEVICHERYLEKLHFLKEKLKKMKKNHYGLMISLQLMQKELQRLRRQL